MLLLRLNLSACISTQTLRKGTLAATEIESFHYNSAFLSNRLFDFRHRTQTDATTNHDFPQFSHLRPIINVHVRAITKTDVSFILTWPHYSIPVSQKDDSTCTESAVISSSRCFLFQAVTPSTSGTIDDCIDPRDRSSRRINAITDTSPGMTYSSLTSLFTPHLYPSSLPRWISPAHLLGTVVHLALETMTWSKLHVRELQVWT